MADAASTDNDAALVECGFCPNDCCVPDGMGGSHEREGFLCCCATSCGRSRRAQADSDGHTADPSAAPAIRA